MYSPQTRLVIAGWFWRTILVVIGMDAVATPWRTIYILREAKNDGQLIAHELAHIHQMQRDGQLKFWSFYYWWLITRGYWNNPYEIEARKLAANGLVGILGR